MMFVVTSFFSNALKAVGLSAVLLFFSFPSVARASDCISLLAHSTEETSAPSLERLMEQLAGFLADVKSSGEFGFIDERIYETKLDELVQTLSEANYKDAEIEEIIEEIEYRSGEIVTARIIEAAKNTEAERENLEEEATSLLFKVEKILRGHKGEVRSVAWSPDGKRVITGSYDNTANVWDVENGAILSTLKGHLGWVDSVAWSPDGKKVVTGSWDTTAIVWDADTGAKLLLFTKHRGYVYAAAWSPDGKKVVTGSKDQTAIIWDTGTGQVFRSLLGHTGLVLSTAWSPDGKKVISGAADRTAIIRSLSTLDDLEEGER